MHTIIRDRATTTDNFVFYTDRLLRLVSSVVCKNPKPQTLSPKPSPLSQETHLEASPRGPWANRSRPSPLSTQVLRVAYVHTYCYSCTMHVPVCKSELNLFTVHSQAIVHCNVLSVAMLSLDSGAFFSHYKYRLLLPCLVSWRPLIPCLL